MNSPSAPRRRRTRGNAWYWQQTDSWYYTPPGSKSRVRLLDDNGQPIRGKDSRPGADLALARIKASGNWKPEVKPIPEEQWQVARVCSTYVEACRERSAKGALHPDYFAEVVRYLNGLCEYGGALPVADLRKGHIMHWVESQPTWQSSATRRNAMTIVLAAFNHASEAYGIPHLLRGLKKPPQKPRLLSISAEDEQELYSATDEAFGDFLFAAIHTGLRPYCELAKLTRGDVLETERGMMWRVFSSKTKKTRKIPIQQKVAERARKLLANTSSDADAVVFRNPLGRPWKKVTGVHRFLTIKRNLGWDNDPVRKRYSSYICRHTFAHRMLAGYWNGGRGCSIEVLAELMGDTPKVAFDHYGKEWGQHYQDPLWAAIGASNGQRK
ncbi:MAG: tyrosine-type recombinase/integrase [Planctomycetaceae bacterium]